MWIPVLISMAATIAGLVILSTCIYKYKRGNIIQILKHHKIIPKSGINSVPNSTDDEIKTCM